MEMARYDSALHGHNPEVCSSKHPNLCIYLGERSNARLWTTCMGYHAEAYHGHLVR